MIQRSLKPLHFSYKPFHVVRYILKVLRTHVFVYLLQNSKCFLVFSLRDLQVCGSDECNAPNGTQAHSSHKTLTCPQHSASSPTCCLSAAPAYASPFGPNNLRKLKLFVESLQRSSSMEESLLIICCLWSKSVPVCSFSLTYSLNKSSHRHDFQPPPRKTKFFQKIITQ